MLLIERKNLLNWILIIMIKPYYQDDYVTIYNADCREVLPEMPKVDLICTDPPYGIQKVWKGGVGHGWGKAKNDNKLRSEWDEKPIDFRWLYATLLKGEKAICWGANYYPFSPSRCWFVWNKPERGFSLAEAELAWTNFDSVIRVFDCPRSDYGREHPTQKPLKLMKWCIEQAGEPQTILDPFAGSCTTGRAAKDLNRKCICIELEEKYCETGANRMLQEVMNFGGIND